MSILIAIIMIYQALKIRSKKDTDEEKINDNQNQDWMSTFHQKKSEMIDTSLQN